MNTLGGDLGAIPLGNEDGIPVALFVRKQRLLLCFYKKPYT
jgi:hypothetical protein